MPIDRVYIEAFLTNHRTDIHGAVLEFSEPYYTRMFGGDRVTRSEVIHRVEGNPQATMVRDIGCEPIAFEQFDCIICTQVLHYVYDVRAALGFLQDALKPGGVLLVTVPGITGQSSDNPSQWPDLWRFTKASIERLATNVFGIHNIAVESHGNVLAAAAFLFGLAAEDLPKGTLDIYDPSREVTITLRAWK